MSKTKNTDDEEVVRLLEENRELKQTIRTLQKRLKKLDRGHIKSRERNVSKSDLYEEEVEYCPECNKGKVIVAIVANRKLKRCDSCSWRSKAIKLNV